MTGGGSERLLRCIIGKPLRMPNGERFMITGDGKFIQGEGATLVTIPTEKGTKEFRNVVLFVTNEGHTGIAESKGAPPQATIIHDI